jgi:hypothetical protein
VKYFLVDAVHTVIVIYNGEEYFDGGKFMTKEVSCENEKCGAKFSLRYKFQNTQIVEEGKR